MLARTTRPRLGVELLEDRLTPNSRFVVPTAVPADNVTTFHTLSVALSTPGLASGDAVEVQAFSTPGTLTDAALDAINAPNVTIRGAYGTPAPEQPVIRTSGQIVLDPPEAGLTFQNVNLLIDSLVFVYANATFADSHIVIGAGGINGIEFYGTSAAVVRNNVITNSGSIYANGLYFHNPPVGSANVIDSNTFGSVSTRPATISYSVEGVLGGSRPLTDVVSNNTFVGSSAGEGESAILYASNTDGLTVRGNTFLGRTPGSRGVYLVNARNTLVAHNVFDMTNVATSSVPALDVWSYYGTAAGTTVRGNTFSTGEYGTAVTLRFNNYFGNTTPTPVLLEGNNFLATPLGVQVSGSEGLASRVDLGGGPLGGRGGNNFRKFLAPATATSGAIVVENGATYTVNARNNLFAVPDPETVIWDRAETNTAADVDATGSLFGNAGFVQALYTRHLKRIGDVTNPSDAGYWVNQMAAGMTSGQVANFITRSAEALGHVVDGMYRKILLRDADAGGRAHYVDLLGRGWTVEMAEASLYASAEYAARIPGNAAYVTSLFQTILGRTPDAASVGYWVDRLPALGRSGVATAFLTSTEYRQQVVYGLYEDFLKRGPAGIPSPEAIDYWVNSGLDLLSLRVAFASTQEFSLYG